MVEWLKGCEICDASLIEEVDKFVALNMSVKAAARELLKQQKAILGTELYSVSSIENRYRYHKGLKKACQNDTKNTEKISAICPPVTIGFVSTQFNIKGLVGCDAYATCGVDVS